MNGIAVKLMMPPLVASQTAAAVNIGQARSPVSTAKRSFRQVGANADKHNALGGKKPRPEGNPSTRKVQPQITGAETGRAATIPGTHVSENVPVATAVPAFSGILHTAQIVGKTLGRAGLTESYRQKAPAETSGPVLSVAAVSGRKATDASLSPMSLGARNGSNKTVSSKSDKDIAGHRLPAPDNGPSRSASNLRASAIGTRIISAKAYVNAAQGGPVASGKDVSFSRLPAKAGRDATATLSEAPVKVVQDKPLISDKNALSARVFTEAGPVRTQSVPPSVNGEVSRGTPQAQEPDAGRVEAKALFSPRTEIPVGDLRSAPSQTEVEQITGTVQQFQTATPAPGGDGTEQKGVRPQESGQVRVHGSTHAMRVEGEPEGALEGGQQGAGAAVERLASQADMPQPSTRPSGPTDSTVRFDSGGQPLEPTRDAPPVSVADQVATALRASTTRSERQLVIRLNPPELGKVRVALIADDKVFRGVLTADNSSTLSQLQREAPVLLSRLAEAGIQLRRLDVTLSEQSSGGADAHSHLRDNSGAWREDSTGGAQHQPTQVGSAADDRMSAGVPETPAGPDAITEGSINVWI